MSDDTMFALDPKLLLKSFLLHTKDKGLWNFFDIPLKACFSPSQHDPFAVARFGKKLENPLGLAAGPHTQLAQNIVSGWLAGARFFELKTVQQLDELKLTKPCIDMFDEGYNCEWSQELRLQQSYSEYLNAFVLIHIFRHILGHDDQNSKSPGSTQAHDPGFIFNMSAGYTLEGLKSPAMRDFFAKMQNAQSDIEALILELAQVYPQARQIIISPCISDNITLSTMHGCPPADIEAMAAYFMEELGLHTAIKLNPTLLGAKQVRSILSSLGWPIEVPDSAFEEDLHFEAALDLIKKLQKRAQNCGREFHVKICNTLQSLNNRNILPEQEKMLYMSGRALHPLALHMALQLQESFHGSLNLSFCAGVNTQNLIPTLTSGLSPITLCSDLLRPGGYLKINHGLQQLKQYMQDLEVDSLQALVLAQNKDQNLEEALLHNLRKNAQESLNPAGPYAFTSGISRKFPTIRRALPLFDCAAAACVEVCPTEQRPPVYLTHFAHSDEQQAKLALLERNPLFHTQAYYCENLCRHKCEKICTRRFVDSSVGIQAVRERVQNISSQKPLSNQEQHKVSIIGAGLAGLVCAAALRAQGLAVEVWEIKDSRTMELDFGALADALKQDQMSLVQQGVLFFQRTWEDVETFLHNCALSSAVFVTADALCLGSGKAKRPQVDLGRQQAVEMVIFGSAPKSSFRIGKSPTCGPASLHDNLAEGLAVVEFFMKYLHLNFIRAEIPAPAQCCGRHQVPLHQTHQVISSTAQARAEASLCLRCHQDCGICVAVCPNRAPQAFVSYTKPVPVYTLRPRMTEQSNVRGNVLRLMKCHQKTQVLHLADACNECGNCATFCPSAGAPYKDKLHLHISTKSYSQSQAQKTGHCLLLPHGLKYKDSQQEAMLVQEGTTLHYSDARFSLYFNPETFDLLTASSQYLFTTVEAETGLVMSLASELFLVYKTTSPMRELL